MISKKLGFNLAKRFLIRAIHKRKEFYLGDRIVNELLDVLQVNLLHFIIKEMFTQKLPKIVLYATSPR